MSSKLQKHLTLTRRSSLLPVWALAALLWSAPVTTGCSTFQPDYTPFAVATTDLYRGMALIGAESERELETLAASVVCRGANVEYLDQAEIVDLTTAGAKPTAATGQIRSERVSPRQCFRIRWHRHLAATAVLAAYAHDLARSTRQGFASRTMVAVERLFGTLAITPDLEMVADTAQRALSDWRTNRSADNLGEILLLATPHVVDVVDALRSELAVTRTVLWQISRKVHLDRVDTHDSELLLREDLEQRRRRLIHRLTAESSRVHLGDDFEQANTLSKLAQIEGVLSRLPSEDTLHPAEIDVALASVDAVMHALAAWREAHIMLTWAQLERVPLRLSALQAAVCEVHSVARLCCAHCQYGVCREMADGEAEAIERPQDWSDKATFLVGLRIAFMP